MKTVLCKEVEKTRNTGEDLGECSAEEEDGCRQTSYFGFVEGLVRIVLVS